MTLDAVNALPTQLAAAEFARCCGSSRWAASMAAARPFDRLETMQKTADTVWASLGREDWLEAFGAHPKIGDARGASAWSAAEQSGMQSADRVTALRLADFNARYERRFGYIFIVCATGKSPADMLEMIETRLSNDPREELAIAAAEQRKITRLRLAKLVEAT
jgi:2-oxo-4-hydroxy-4-carboxy-5-ureidoimidazoline decarboxylase